MARNMSGAVLLPAVVGGNDSGFAFYRLSADGGKLVKSRVFSAEFDSCYFTLLGDGRSGCASFVSYRYYGFSGDG